MGEDYSYAADVWGVGLCVYELASGKYPYGVVDSYPILYNLFKQPEPRLDARHFTEHLCNFVARCIVHQPEQRATTIQLQAHEFIVTAMFQVSQTELISWLEGVMGRADSR